MDIKPVINLADVELQDVGNAEGFAAKVGGFGRLIGSTGMGVMLHVVEPGKKASPCHAHHHIHELFDWASGKGGVRFLARMGDKGLGYFDGERLPGARSGSPQERRTR